MHMYRPVGFTQVAEAVAVGHLLDPARDVTCTGRLDPDGFAFTHANHVDDAEQVLANLGMGIPLFYYGGEVSLFS